MKKVMWTASAGLVAAVLAFGGCVDSSQCSTGEACSKSCPEGQSGLCVARGICECVRGGGIGDGGLPEDGGVPVVDDCRAAAPGELVITELLADGEGGDDDTEFVEIVNSAREPVSVRGLQLNQVALGESLVEMELEAGCIPAHGAVAFFRSVDLTVSHPSTGIAYAVVGGKFAFPNSKSADYTLTDAQGGLMSHFEVSEHQIEAGVSVARPTLDSVDFELHNQISDLPRSPGLCPNGGTYHTSCEAPPEMDAGVGEDAGQPICDPPARGDLVLNEILVDGEADRDGNEFVEVVNTAAHPVSVVGLSVGKADVEGSVIFEGGCIPALGAVAIGKGEPATWAWDPVPSPFPSASKTGLSLANSGDYTMVLSNASGELSRLVVAGNPIRSGVSLNRSPDLIGEALVLHDSLEGRPYSAATCPNGGRYAEGCVAGPQGDAGVDDDLGIGEDAGVPVDMEPPPQCDPPNPGDLVLNELLVDGSAGSTETDEFVELVNTADRPVNMAGFIIDAIRGDREPVEFGHFTGGCMVAGGAAALRRSVETTVFEPAEGAPDYVPNNQRLANGDPWTFVLRDAGAEFSRLAVDDALYANGVSANRQPDLVGVGAVAHPMVGEGDSSPARCPNGALYTAGCTP
jgi:hypothetical protein